MIFLNKVSEAPTKSIMYIPYTLLREDYKEDFLILDGGFSKDEQLKAIDCGNASTESTNVINGGYAKFDGSITLNIKLIHTISREEFTYNVQPIEVNDTYFKVVFVFNSIPPLGQYEIDVTKDNETIYSGMLQIGDIKNNNKVYNKIIKYNIYE